MVEAQPRVRVRAVVMVLPQRPATGPRSPQEGFPGSRVRATPAVGTECHPLVEVTAVAPLRSLTERHLVGTRLALLRPSSTAEAPEAGVMAGGTVEVQGGIKPLPLSSKVNQGGPFGKRWIDAQRVF